MQYLAVGVIVVGVITYIISLWNSNDPKNPDKQNIAGDQSNPENQNDRGSGDQKIPTHGTTGGSTNSGTNGNADMNYNNTFKVDPNNPQAGNSQELKNATPPDPASFQDLSQPCPTRTDKYREVLNCPRIPQLLKALLREMNYKRTKEDCDLESRTTNITLGTRFIAWTLHQSNSCENKAYPQGLSEERTYLLEDGAEVAFGDHFDLMALEKYYRASVNLKSGLDENKEQCSAPKERNRGKLLGSLESEFTKAQFRLVDNTKVVRLKMQTFYAGRLGRVCSLESFVPDWRTYLVKDSKFKKNFKAGELFKQ